MDDHRTPKEWDDLTDDIITIYGVIRTALSYLPIQIGLAQWNVDWTPPAEIAALGALNHARKELIPPQPISKEHKEMLQGGILDWLTAYDVSGFLWIAADPLEWRANAVEHLIRRAELAIGKVALDLKIAEREE